MDLCSSSKIVILWKKTSLCLAVKPVWDWIENFLSSTTGQLPVRLEIGVDIHSPVEEETVNQTIVENWLHG